MRHPTVGRARGRAGAQCVARANSSSLARRTTAWPEAPPFRPGGCRGPAPGRTPHWRRRFPGRLAGPARLRHPKALVPSQQDSGSRRSGARRFLGIARFRRVREAHEPRGLSPGGARRTWSLRSGRAVVGSATSRSATTGRQAGASHRIGRGVGESAREDSQRQEDPSLVGTRPLPAEVEQGTGAERAVTHRGVVGGQRADAGLELGKDLPELALCTSRRRSRSLAASPSSRSQRPWMISYDGVRSTFRFPGRRALDKRCHRRSDTGPAGPGVEGCKVDDPLGLQPQSEPARHEYRQLRAVGQQRLHDICAAVGEPFAVVEDEQHTLVRHHPSPQRADGGGDRQSEGPGHRAGQGVRVGDGSDGYPADAESGPSAMHCAPAAASLPPPAATCLLRPRRRS